MRYNVVITETARIMMRNLRKFGKGTLEQLQRVIDDLQFEPMEKSQPLGNELAGFRSIHVGRFRIVIKIVEKEVRVYVFGVGWHESGSRDDVYQIVARMLAKETKK